MQAKVIEELCKLPHAANLQQICDLTYQIIGNPVFISDLAHTILAYTKCVEVEDANWQENVVHAKLERNTLIQDREVAMVHDSSTTGHKPVLVEDDHMALPRIIKTLTNKGHAVGVMVLTAYLHPFDPSDLELMDLISSFVIPRMLEEQYHISDDEKTIENYFIKLLDGVQFTHERVEKRLSILGYEQMPFTYVLSICPAADPSHKKGGDLRGLLDAFRQIKNCRIFLYNTALVCVCGSETDISNWEMQMPELSRLLREESLIAGVSRRIRDLRDLREYYQQAQEALGIQRKLTRKNLYSRYDDLSSFKLFYNIPKEKLPIYCHQKIQELGAYDDLHHMELCVTLQVYLEQAKSLAKTAEILYIHRNTVRYRINKCMELLNTDLEDGNEIFAFIMSLRILEFKRKFLSEMEKHS